MSEKKNFNLKKLTSAIFSPALFGFFVLILYCSWAYLNIWEVNFINNEYIDYRRLFYAYGITLAFASVLSLLIYLCTRFRSLERSLFAAAAFIAVFFNFPSFSQYIGSSLIIFFVFLGVVTAGVYYLSKNTLFKKLAFIIPIAAIIGILYNSINQKSMVETADQTDWSKSVFANLNKKPKHTPNVYFIVLDSTLRVDAYKRFFDKEAKYYDDFLTYAKEKGFYVVENAYSNYPVTGFSVPSTLNMDFMTWSKSEGPLEIRERTLTSPETIHAALKGYNAVTVAFKARGYKIYHTSNGFLPASDCGGFEDNCVRKKANSLFFTQQELGLIKMTPLDAILEKFPLKITRSPDALIPDVRDETISFYYSFQPRDIPQYIPENEGKPFFWFIHLMGMHNLAFDENCNYKHPGYDPSGEMPTYKKLNPACGGGTSFDRGRMAGYRIQLPCMLLQLELAINEIVKRDPTSIIIIQGDHGSSVVNNFKERPTEQWTEKDVHEIFSILNIIRCPAECQKLLYPDMTPVNTFRVIFSYLDDKKYPLLPDISYIAAYANWWPSYKNGDADLLNPLLKKHPLSCDVQKQ